MSLVVEQALPIAGVLAGQSVGLSLGMAQFHSRPQLGAEGKLMQLQHVSVDAHALPAAEHLLPAAVPVEHAAGAPTEPALSVSPALPAWLPPAALPADPASAAPPPARLG